MSRRHSVPGGYPARETEKNQEKGKHQKDSTIQHRNAENAYDNRHNILKREDMKSSKDYS